MTSANSLSPTSTTTAMNTLGMHFQLPLPTGYESIRHTSHHAPLLTQEFAVRVYPGLFLNKDDDAPLISIALAKKNAMIPTEDELEARLYLQYFYGARQIVSQVLRILRETGYISEEESLGNLKL
jgi:hypothetical protein